MKKLNIESESEYERIGLLSLIYLYFKNIPEESYPKIEAPELEQSFLNTIHRKLIKQKLKTVYKKLYQKVAIIFICLLVIGGVAFGFRSEIYNLIIEKHEDYILINPQEQPKGGTIKVANGYLPAYIPDGFVLSPDTKIYEKSGSLSYAKGNKIFILNWIIGDSNLAIDYLDKNGVQTLKIGDTEAILTERDGWYRLSWGMEPQFILTGNIDREEMRQIAESVIYVPEKGVK